MILLAFMAEVNNNRQSRTDFFPAKCHSGTNPAPNLVHPALGAPL